ncbi:MAG TPA: hypothetical protein VFV33_16545 [Gemmatimonadaceae bacterium]|nr:hypothetical protein [Gemmatimonadaceae bacterium]
MTPHRGARPRPAARAGPLRAVRASAVVAMWLAAAALGAIAPRRAAAQRPSGRQFEARLDAIAASTPALQLGAGVNIPAGLYVRLGATAAGGLAHRDGVTHGSARAEVIARFLLDPFNEFPLALYGLGGLSAMVDPFEEWRPRVVVGLGLESRVRNRRAIAAELSVGGGVRIGAVIRRGRRLGR